MEVDGNGSKWRREKWISKWKNKFNNRSQEYMLEWWTIKMKLWPTITHPIKCHTDRYRWSKSVLELVRRDSMTQQTVEWRGLCRPLQWPVGIFKQINCHVSSGGSSVLTWRRRGAPVKLWSPAPSVDKKDPIKITHSFGHAMLATTSLPPIDWPNLIAVINYMLVL